MKEKNPRISVIMSTCNTAEEYLRKSIESILNQTYENFEFIIVIDGADKDFEIVSSYKDERIKIIKHDTNIGLTKSLNETIKIAKGKYIARMDSDDISLKDRFEIQIKFLEENTDIDICATYTKNIEDSKKTNVNINNTPDKLKAELFLYNNVPHPTIMIRKEFLDKNDIWYDESFRYSQDYELWTRCSKIGKIYIIPQICLLYRVHKSQISTAKAKEQAELCKRIYEKNLEEIGIEDVSNKVKYMFYLSGKEAGEYSEKELIRFINEILESNEKTKIYGTKILKKILLARLFRIALRERKILMAIKYLLKSNAIAGYIKKCYLSVICNIKLSIKKENINAK